MSPLANPRFNKISRLNSNEKYYVFRFMNKTLQFEKNEASHSQPQKR